MDTYKSIISLRSVRHFDRSQPIDDQALHRILQAGRMSGSSKNSQPWWFIVIQDQTTLEALAKCGNFAEHLVGATIAIAIVFDPQFYRGEFDSGRTAQNMMLAAWNDGIGSCIASMHREDDTKKVLDVPSEYRLQHIISFGYPQKREQSTPAVKQSGRKPLEEMVYKEKWKNAT